MRAAGFVCVFELRFWRSCVSDIQKQRLTDAEKAEALDFDDDALQLITEEDDNVLLIISPSNLLGDTGMRVITTRIVPSS